LKPKHSAILIAAACVLSTSAPATAQDAEAGRAKSQACAACHGADGNSAAGNFPNLAGQSWRYIYMQLKDFKEGRRKDPVMSPMAEPLSRQDMIDIANYYAGQRPKPSPFKADEQKIRLGKAKADETLCAMCHLGAFAGQNEIPRVAGQQYEYIVKQMKDFKARTRTNDAGNMTAVARTLSDEDVENLAHYITSLR
jgi:cytochrome c553